MYQDISRKKITQTHQPTAATMFQSEKKLENLIQRSVKSGEQGVYKLHSAILITTTLLHRPLTMGSLIIKKEKRNAEPERIILKIT